MRSPALIFMTLAACTAVAPPQGTSSSSGDGSVPQGKVTSKPPAVLAMTPTKGVDFGSVHTGDSGPAQIHVINSGSTTATKIGDGSSSLGDFGYLNGTYSGTGGTCGSALPAGGGCTIVVAFAPTNPGTVKATLTVSYYDGAATQHAALTLNGTGTGASTTGGSSSGSSGGASGGSSSGASGGASSGASGGASSGAGSTSGALPTDPAQATTGNKTVDTLGTFTTASTADANGIAYTGAIVATKAAGDDAITLIAVSAGDAHYLVLDQIKNPNGVTLTDFSFTTFSFGPNAHNRVYPSVGANATLIPQTPDIDTANNELTPAGNYTFVVASDPSVDVDVYVVHTPKSTALRHLDVNFYFSGSAGLTAATAQQASSNFPAVVQTFVKYWGTGPGVACGTAPANSLGLCIDKITYQDMPAGYETIWGDDGADAAAKAGSPTLSDLFATTAGKAQGVSFFVVDDVNLSDGKGGVVNRAAGLLGVDGSIPSPGAFTGTARSGSVLIIDSLTSDPNDSSATLASIAIETGGTIAHEGGHYLGLYHVQEQDCSTDNLADTACMTNTTCVGDGLCTLKPTTGCATPANCTATAKGTLPPTVTNVMFWAQLGKDITQDKFSASQVKTTHRHPLVH